MTANPTTETVPTVGTCMAVLRSAPAASGDTLRETRALRTERFVESLLNGGKPGPWDAPFIEPPIPSSHVVERALRLLDFGVRSARAEFSRAAWKTLLCLMGRPEELLPMLAIESMRFTSHPQDEAGDTVPALDLPGYCVNDLSDLAGVCSSVSRAFNFDPEHSPVYMDVPEATSALDIDLVRLIKIMLNLLNEYTTVHVLAGNLCSDAVYDTQGSNADSNIGVDCAVERTAAAFEALRAAINALETQSCLLVVDHLIDAVTHLRSCILGLSVLNASSLFEIDAPDPASTHP